VAKAKEKTPVEPKELTQLRAQLGKLERGLDSAKAENVSLKDRQKEQLAALLEENRALSERYANLETSYAHAVAAAEDLRRKFDALSAEHATAKTELIELRKTAAERMRLQGQVISLEKQLQSKDRAPILQAADVTALINALFDDLRANLGDMALKDGELRLQVGFAGAGGIKGFVLPTVDGTADIKGPLQELLIRFDRKAGE
jgi:chromosome segregation ATPase